MCYSYSKRGYICQRNKDPKRTRKTFIIKKSYLTGGQYTEERSLQKRRAQAYLDTGVVWDSDMDGDDYPDLVRNH